MILAQEETMNTVASEVKKHFKASHDALVNDEGRKVLVSHFGTISQELLGSLSNGVEELLISKGDRKIVIKRMFSILLEGLQNIRLHGELDEAGKQLAFLVISENDAEYKVLMSNIIHLEEEGKITNYLNEINGYTPEVLKEQYIAILSNEFMSAKGGAGLGLITTRMKSGPLNSQFHQLNDELALFVLEVTLDRVKK